MDFFPNKVSRETYLYNSIPRIIPIPNQKNDSNANQNKKESQKDKIILSEEAKKFIVKKQEG
jgi:hypothetical protein